MDVVHTLFTFKHCLNLVEVYTLFSFCLHLILILKVQEIENLLLPSTLFSPSRFGCWRALFLAYQDLKSDLKSGEIKYFLGCLGSGELGR